MEGDQRVSFKKLYYDVPSGFMKLKSSAWWTTGFLKRMDIPRFMKGLVKSITFSLKLSSDIVGNFNNFFFKNINNYELFIAKIEVNCAGFSLGDICKIISRYN